MKRLIYFFLMALSSNVMGASYTKIDIFFVGWGVLWQTRCDELRVPANYRTFFQLKNEADIKDFMELLNISSLVPYEVLLKREGEKLGAAAHRIPSIVKPTARMLIDLYDSDGKKRSYCLDGVYMFDLENRKASKVPRAFLDKFELMWKAK
ncbi:MAG: hypothetical protein HYV97_00450 [Bdellovibrio sp.]|nr:hypothetical protein [Bdellovibrio sp.]